VLALQTDPALEVFEGWARRLELVLGDVNVVAVAEELATWRTRTRSNIRWCQDTVDGDNRQESRVITTARADNGGVIGNPSLKGRDRASRGPPARRNIA